MITSNIEQFSHQSHGIKTFLTEQEQSIEQTHLSMKQFLDSISQLNQINIEHSEEIDIANIDFLKRYEQISPNDSHVDLTEEMINVKMLETMKQQLEKELLEQTILLENISTIIGKAID